MEYDLSTINLVLISDVSKLAEKIEELKGRREGGTLIMVDIAALRKQVKETNTDPSGDWVNVIKNIVKKLKTWLRCDLLVLDSLSALYALSDFTEARSKLFYIFEFLRDVEITSYVITEMYAPKKYGEYGVEDYLADGIVHLEMLEKMRKVERTLSIVKMRATNCNLDVFTLEFEGGKFKVLYGGEPPLI
jgi:KaiC/GvpD/RAD55 family RecA-like ATPase